MAVKQGGTLGWGILGRPRRRRRLSRRSKYPPPEPEGDRRGRRWRAKRLIFPSLLALLAIVLMVAAWILKQQPAPARVPISSPLPHPLREQPLGFDRQPP